MGAINEEAGVSVKLVSCIGIGTVACGVAKADADVIQISGGDGGTGASPLSSIKHAGGPWELGLSEAHSALVMNNLRERVTLRVDGGIRTGRDVLIGALMGAEEFGFGTIAMIAEGCIMARVCHLNTCPVGVATQNPDLRKKFPGTPEHVVNYFAQVAGEVRGLMASMGYTSLDEIIGRGDLLVATADKADKVQKTRGVTTAFLTDLPSAKTVDERAWNKHVANLPVEHVNSIGEHCDDRLLSANLALAAAVDAGGGAVTVEGTVINTDRTALSRIAGALALRRTNGARVDNDLIGQTMHFKLRGASGQSFGAFLVDGMVASLEGESNDYVGKGLCGGRIEVFPPKEHKF